LPPYSYHYHHQPTTDIETFSELFYSFLITIVACFLNILLLPSVLLRLQLFLFHVLSDLALTPFTTLREKKVQKKKKKIQTQKKFDLLFKS
jgi:uncharacterized membrane protein